MHSLLIIDSISMKAFTGVMYVPDIISDVAIIDQGFIYRSVPRVLVIIHNALSVEIPTSINSCSLTNHDTNTLSTID